MKILYTFGPATNSSSTHYIIYMPGNSNLNRMSPEITERGYFGWGFDVITDPAWKMEYCRVQLYQRMPKTDSSIEKIEQLLGPFILREKLTDVIMDHQSLWDFPEKNGEIDLEYIQIMKSIMEDPDVAIVLDNDNDNLFPKWAKQKNISKIIPISMLLGNLTRKKKNGHGFSLYHPMLNWKAKITVDYETSGNPWELVDLKITDKCFHNCAYCYQNSTKNGKHAEVHNIYRIIDELAKLEIFEIAIGGGEPLLHPDIINILKYIRSKNIYPSISTRRLNAALLRPAFSLCGGIGFSVDKLADLIELEHFLKTRMDKTPLHAHLYFHYIMDGDIGKWASMAYYFNKSKILKSFISGWILLGPKFTGRSNLIIPSKDHVQEYLNIAETLQVDIGLDTAGIKLLSEYGITPPKVDVDGDVYINTEGEHSFYIDAVNLIMGRDSYSPSTFEPLNIQRLSKMKRRPKTWM